MIAQSDLIVCLFGLDQFQIDELSIYICDSTWAWKPPVFSDFDFWMVLSGCGHLSVNGKFYPLAPGVGFLLQPGDRVEGGKKRDDALTVLACHIATERQLNPQGRLTPEVLHFRTSDIDFFCRQGEEALRLQQMGRSILSQVIVKLLIAEMVVSALKSDDTSFSERAPSALYDLLLDIKLQPGKKWLLPDMARRCSLSVPQFTRLFRRAFATSPKQFVIMQRVRRAVYLLRESEITIQEIAGSLGYSDHFFFHRQFKSVTGVTPVEARNGAATSLE